MYDVVIGIWSSLTEIKPCTQQVIPTFLANSSFTFTIFTSNKQIQMFFSLLVNGQHSTAWRCVLHVHLIDRNRSKKHITLERYMWKSSMRRVSIIPILILPSLVVWRREGIQSENDLFMKIANYVHLMTINYVIVSPNGTLLCCTSRRKLEWYVRKGLGGFVLKICITW